MIKDNQKVAVSHVLSAIKPRSLRDRLSSDIKFSYIECRKDFKAFLKHAVRVSEAFQLVDTGPNARPKTDRSTTSNRGGNQDSTGSRPSGNSPTASRSSKRSSSAPDCPFGVCKTKGLKHWIRNCPNATETEKQRMLEDIAAAKARNGPHSSTRSKTVSSGAGSSRSETKSSNVVGRMTKKKTTDRKAFNTPSCPVTVSDGRESITATARCDDGSDDSLVSPKLAERAAVKGIGKITAIEPVRLNVALKTGDEAQSFFVSRTWVAPRTVLQLSSGQLALANVTFLVADDDLACEELIIGLPVLRHCK